MCTAVVQDEIVSVVDKEFLPFPDVAGGTQHSLIGGHIARGYGETHIVFVIHHRPHTSATCAIFVRVVGNLHGVWGGVRGVPLIQDGRVDLLSAILRDHVIGVEQDVIACGHAFPLREDALPGVRLRGRANAQFALSQQMLPTQWHPNAHTVAAPLPS
jgi:hypothetical protein